MITNLSNPNLANTQNSEEELQLDDDEIDMDTQNTTTNLNPVRRNSNETQTNNQNVPRGDYEMVLYNGENIVMYNAENQILVADKHGKNHRNNNTHGNVDEQSIAAEMTRCPLCQQTVSPRFAFMAHTYFRILQQMNTRRENNDNNLFSHRRRESNGNEDSGYPRNNSDSSNEPTYTENNKNRPEREGEFPNTKNIPTFVNCTNSSF